MRDDRMKWHASTGDFITVNRRDVSLRVVKLTRQTLISGTHLGATAHGAIHWPDICIGTDYTLCLKRDQILQIGGDARALGWDPLREEASSNMSQAYVVFELTGHQALEVIQRGAEIDLETPSKSVMRLLFGDVVALYRHGDRDTFRIHVERPAAMGHYSALTTAIENASHQSHG